MMSRIAVLALLLLGLAQIALCQDGSPLAGTSPLTMSGDLSVQMVAGISNFLSNETARSVVERQKLWHRDFSSRAAYEQSVASNRERLGKMIGAVDRRLPVHALQFVSGTDSPAMVAPSDAYTVQAVRWPVLEDVYAEGLWLRPKSTPLARVIAIPDADQTPEMVIGLTPGLPPERQFARRLAENGCEVLVPTLVDRQETFSGNALLARFTNQPHREWIYRQAFELGRHIIGYEVQKVLAAVDFFESEDQKSGIKNPAPGVMGYAEGGLIALYAAALDTRIAVALVSGYFDSRQRLWEEPIYRNVFGLLREFGDAEIATLVGPRKLIVEHSPASKVEGPPTPRTGRAGAAPGKLSTPDYESVEGEVERARALVKAGAKAFDTIDFIAGTEGMATGPGSDRALTAFLIALGVPAARMKLPGQALVDARAAFDPAERQHRQVDQLEAFTQRLLRRSEKARTDFFWNHIKTSSPETWQSNSALYRRILAEETIGQLAPCWVPANPRTRQIVERPKWIGYDVVLDVCADVFAWGYLLLPRALKPGERRPVVVCQHGLEGLPADIINEVPESEAFHYYKALGARLAERGFVVFAPHNPYRGGDRFRKLQRQANPLGKSLFSFIIAQHSRILDWLCEQPFVDAHRIGFYGLSYGGKTAMRVPAVLDRYALSICSGDFNDWISKNASVDFPGSYMFLGEYEMPEFNLGQTFNYAEMAALIAPRPFMVERGHRDGVGIDEWVALEYAKVRRLYDELGIPERTTIEFFSGGHTINGVGTFEFLHRHLNWPVPKD